MAVDHRPVDVEQVAVERRDAGRRKDDAVGPDRQQRGEDADDAQEQALASEVFEPAHRRLGSGGGRRCSDRPACFSPSLISWAMTSGDLRSAA